MKVKPCYACVYLVKEHLKECGQTAPWDMDTLNEIIEILEKLEDEVSK